MEAIKDSKEPLDFWSWWNDLMSCGCGGRAGETKFTPPSVSTSKMDFNTLQPNRGSVGLILQKRNNEYANLDVSLCHSKINLFPSHGGMRVVAIAADGPARRCGVIKTGMLVNVIDGTPVADLTEDEARHSPCSRVETTGQFFDVSLVREVLTSGARFSFPGMSRSGRNIRI
ncbi:hypothetical protein GUITHDRAFT_99572 [Guillardia theta CCMP2712]|uniref:PDZ domain-containing protein n=1 Tax=Guillardia theta (strain CCMP2712) TaxID=905079 RepID=L1K269_GUITC|nr:hypothetical protein GUITHDRAFT_99572 [Guillardia theta CCMP2712]EKX54921.1 hypothetical protein GUITHDRAFT_99572 [Guillardia theta CCMP2712]|eukprot:XP_005841901.1 hypothetical protein GUITHDRAFT_99572 [Guillardia theta CCMP2712]